ncbi:hypothetical protein [Tychonema sp. LEGE 07203]|nr:hypothetical protein [Tychonema sp. LEGE 07203]MBE9096851.1 hypothetical protein [Tychonema sp. LEGE 07203]
MLTSAGASGLIGRSSVIGFGFVPSGKAFTNKVRSLGKEAVTPAPLSA